MDTKSEYYLLKVHPDLAKVMRKTSQEPQAFRICQGIRTVEEEEKAVKSGNSKTMHSRHLPNRQGLSCAVDVIALINGKPSWAVGKEAEVYGQIAAQVKQAASELDIPVEWGGDWKWKDWGHYQLPWDKYK